MCIQFCREDSPDEDVPDVWAHLLVRLKWCEQCRRWERMGRSYAG
jgi:hypothetical protein